MEVFVVSVYTAADFFLYGGNLIISDLVQYSIRQLQLQEISGAFIVCGHVWLLCPFIVLGGIHITSFCQLAAGPVTRSRLLLQE